MLYKASAPGSLMLLGEYAVLHDHSALVCAIDKRITVTLEPRDDDCIYIRSHLGALLTTVPTIAVLGPLKFVLMTLKKYQPHLRVGCNLTIESDFSEQMGFASSAAVTVATLSAVLAWLGISCSLDELVKNARDIVLELQGVGSGADVAASVYGGIISYEQKPLVVKKFLQTFPITVLYSGTKVSTVRAIEQVHKVFADQRAKFSYIIHDIGYYAKEGAALMAKNNWQALGPLMNLQQKQMNALGVGTPILTNLVETLLSDDSILGAKISGAGFGDCVVGLGAAKAALPSVVPVNITEQGMCCETN